MKEPLPAVVNRKDAKKLVKRQSIRENNPISRNSSSPAKKPKEVVKPKPPKKEKAKKLNKKDVEKLQKDAAAAVRDVAPVLRRWENVELGYVTSDDEDGDADAIAGIAEAVQGKTGRGKGKGKKHAFRKY